MSTVTSPTGRRSRRSVDSETVRAGRVYLLALLLLSLFAWAPLLYPGYVQVHSGFLPVFNLADLAASSDKLRWLPTIGVTPDLLRSEGPLAYWLALPLRPLAGDIGAVKGVLALSIIAAGLGMLAWTRRDLAVFAGDPSGDADAAANPQGLVSARAGLLAAVVAMLWPPLLATVYVRGALGEVVFAALLPWVLWAVAGCRRLRSTPEGRAWRGQAAGAAAAGLLVAALAWTQAGLALWATLLTLAWALWPGAPRRSRGVAATAAALGALLGGGLFWLLHRGQDLASQPLDVAAHAVYPYQLLAPAWGFGVSTTGWQDGLPLQLGLAALGLAALTVVLGLGRSAQRQTADRRSPITYPLSFAALMALILILLTTTLARALWRIDLLAATVAYPWQLVLLVGPLLALLAGGLLAVERRMAVLPVWAALVALVVLSSYPYLAPRFTQATPDAAAPAIFGAGQVTLVGGEVGAPLTATTPLTVTVAWQALQPVDFDYNVFVHAVDADGNRVAQWDGQPQRDGEPYPMTTWPVGEVVGNSYRLELDPAAPPVKQVYVGLYNWQTGERLPVNGDDKVTLEVGP